MRPLLACWVLVLAAFASGHARAQEAPPQRPAQPRLYLTGKASIEAKPDFASISIGVQNKAPTTAAAIDLTSAAAARIVAGAKSFGIAPRDVQTSYVSLQAAFRTVRDPNGASEQRPDGYTAGNAVTIRVRDLARLGEFLRVVVDGGANRIDGVEFELADPKALQLDALAAAVRDARRQAETIATAAGAQLGRIEEIRYGVPSSVPYRPRPSARAAAPARQDVPVEAGSLDVSVEVEVVFAIVQP